MTVVRRQFARLKGFDEVAAAAAVWDLDFRLLGGGKGSGAVETVATSRALVQRHRFGWKLHQRGAAPGGLRTFGFGVDGGQEFPWNGHAVEGDWLLSFPEDGSFESVSAESFHAYTLTFDEDLIQDMAELLGLPSGGESRSETGVSKLPAASASRIRQTLQDILQASRKDGFARAGGGQALVRVIEWDLLSQILNAVENGRRMNRPAARLRALALRRSTAFIEEAAGRPVTVRELCEVSGVSWRTLDYAFKERYGLTPKGYLRTRRLNGVHTELRDMSPESRTIASVAWRWGFWHHSRFAADYRKLFGELPSETLRRETVGK